MEFDFLFKFEVRLRLKIINFLFFRGEVFFCINNLLIIEDDISF